MPSFLFSRLGAIRGADALTTSQATQKLPKIAIAQALLNELANDLALPARSPANPYASARLSQDNGVHPKSLIEKMPALILSGKTIPALANCHAALRKLSATSGNDQAVAKLKQVQAQLEDELLCTSELEIKSNYETIRLLSRQSVTVGRPSAMVKGGIGVKCRWLGPIDKNLRIYRDGDAYLIEDLGSNNGYLINGERLRAKHPVEIAFGRTMVEICLASGAIAPLWFQFQRKSSDPDAVAINLGCDKQLLRADLGEKEWLEIKDQLGLTWILFSEKIKLGKSQDCAVVLADCTPANRS